MHRIEVYRRLRVGIVRYWWGDSYRSCKWCISYVAQSHHLCHPIIFRPLGFDWSCFTGIWPPYNICICTISIITSNWSGRIATFLWSCVYQNLWISFISVDRSMGVPRQLPCTFIWRFGVHNTVGNTGATLALNVLDTHQWLMVLDACSSSSRQCIRRHENYGS